MKKNKILLIASFIVSLNVFSAELAPATKTIQKSLVSSIAELLQQKPSDSSLNSYDRIFRADGAGGDVTLQVKGLNTDFVSKLTRENFQASFKQEISIFEPSDWAGNRRESRLILIDGDIFVEGYYRQHRFFEDKSENFNSFVKAQPWFEFQKDTSTYVARTNVAPAARLIKHLLNGKNEVTLYRGVKWQGEADLLIILKQLRSGALSSEQAKSLKQLLEEMISSSHIDEVEKPIYKDLLALVDKTADASVCQQIYTKLLDARYSNGDSASERSFFSPKFELAKQYSGSYTDDHRQVVQVTLSAAAFEKLLAQENSLYVGYEYDYVELMFKGKNAIEELLPSVQLISF